MKKRILFLLSFTTLLFIPFSHSFAQASNTTLPVTLEKGITKNEDYFAAGNTVNLNGTVNGDAYLAGRLVTVRGKITGDLLVAGETVIVSGDITGNIRGAGRHITITGHIGKNLTLAGETVELTKSASAGGSLVAGGRIITLSGPLGKEATLLSGTTHINSTIGGNVLALGQLMLGDMTNINGNLAYHASEKATISKKATIRGRITSTITPQKKPVISNRFLFVLVIYREILSFFASLVVGILLIIFFPFFMESSVELLNGNVLKSFGVGVISIILTPLVFIVLLITIIGAPLGLLLLAFYLIGIYIGRFVIVYAIGKGIMQNKDSVWQFIIGLVIYQIIGLIPVIGLFSKVVVFLLGIGVLYLLGKKSYLRLRDNRTR